MSYAATEETERWKGLLGAYNAYLDRHDIGIALTGDDKRHWVQHLNQRLRAGDVALSQPELIQRHLYRQFINGSFGEGGRMYGGWWINTPKDLRSKITIDAQPTAELDFSGCAIRMLYHERGIDYRDDPYWLGPLADYEVEAGLDVGHFRERIKMMTQALINGRERPEQIRFDDGFSFLPRFRRPDIRRMIEEKHAPISDEFGMGAGVRLQRSDSDLALEIITKLMEREIVALPIHDSFIVTEANRSALHGMMSQCYHNIYRFNPIVN